jgi:DNA-binding NarL/FixJ family response regulator
MHRSDDPDLGGTPMRILIVDDEPLARRGLARELALVPGVELVGECATNLIEQVGVEVMPRVIC